MTQVISRVRQVKGNDFPLLIVYDSIGVSPCEREFSETKLPPNYKPSDWKKIVGRKEQPGERAKACNAGLRKINSLIEKSNTTIFVINQTREKIGVLWGCHFGGSRVWLADGSVRKIKDIVRNKEPVEVLSFNPKNNKIEYKKVIGWHDNGLLNPGEKFLKIKFKREYKNAYGYLLCTPNHVVFKYDGNEIKEVSAGELKKTDKLAITQPFKNVEYKPISGEIVSIGHLKTKMRRKYDLTIEDNATYVVDGAIVHNSPETTAGGGNALPFYASCRMRTQTQKKIIHAKHETVVGVNLKIKNVKNRAFRPFVEVEGIKLYFDHGIDPLSGLTKILVAEERITTKGSGNYSVAEKYLPEGKDKYTFKTTAEASFPQQVLIDCPALIDAESSEEVIEYLKDYATAIENSNSGKFDEKPVHMGGLDELVDGAVESSDEQMEYDRDPENPE